MSKVKFNNVKLKLKNGALLSIAQHYDENGEMLCNEMAVITENVVGEPVEFAPYLDDFLKIANGLHKVMKATT